MYLMPVPSCCHKFLDPSRCSKCIHLLKVMIIQVASIFILYNTPMHFAQTFYTLTKANVPCPSLMSN